MTASITKFFVLLFALVFISTGCANRFEKVSQETRYPDEVDEKRFNVPEMPRENYHAYIEKY